MIEPTSTSVSAPAAEFASSSASKRDRRAAEDEHDGAAAVAEAAHLLALGHDARRRGELDAAHLDGADHDDGHAAERVRLDDGDAPAVPAEHVDGPGDRP